MNTRATTPLILPVIVLVAALGGCTSSPSPASGGGGAATVRFVEPENFTDLQRSGLTAAKSREVLLPVFQRFVQQEAARSLSAGQELRLEFLDVDMAGRIPPTGFREVRVIEDNLPSRLVFRYELRDASGTVVKSGKETLSGFVQDGLSQARNPDELQVEKRLLRDWIRRLSR